MFYVKRKEGVGCSSRACVVGCYGLAIWHKDDGDTWGALVGTRGGTLGAPKQETA